MKEEFSNSDIDLMASTFYLVLQVFRIFALVL